MKKRKPKTASASLYPSITKKYPRFFGFQSVAAASL
jgi:hypothetical protein